MQIRYALFAAAVAAVLSLLPSTRAMATTVTLNAILNGGNECVGAAPPNCLQGDPDGNGTATITMPNNNTICFSVIVDNIDPPTAAHIHSGTATVNGGIVVVLAAPGTGNPGAASGCAATPAGFNAALTKDPASFYVNVHTGAFPAGALRGQVF